MGRILAEHLNPHFGYFYTVKGSLYQTRTAFQDLEIIDTEEFGKVMLLDRVTQVGERNDWLYHEPMVHPALTAHPDPRSVCVIGAGDGGIVREVLKHAPERVVHAELDGGVVAACREHLPGIHGGCWDDERVELLIGDGRAYIEQSDERFDVVIMDMTDPMGPSTMLYTQEYFQAVRQHLRDERGCFVMHAESTISRPQAFQQIIATLESVWSQVTLLHLYIQMYSTLWSIAIAADNDQVVQITREEIARRLADRGIDGLQVYAPASHHAMQAGFPFIDAIRAGAADVPIITDAASTFLDEITINDSQQADSLTTVLNNEQRPTGAD